MGSGDLGSGDFQMGKYPSCRGSISWAEGLEASLHLPWGRPPPHRVTAVCLDWPVPMRLGVSGSLPACVGKCPVPMGLSVSHSGFKARISPPRAVQLWSPSPGPAWGDRCRAGREGQARSRAQEGACLTLGHLLEGRGSWVGGERG